MANLESVCNDSATSSFPTPVVVWIDNGKAFETHLVSTIQTLRKTIILKTFINTNSALEAMSAAVSSCQNNSNRKGKERIACVITNMRRDHPTSGLELLQKMKNVFQTNVLDNEFSSFPPTIVYSASTTNNPSLIDKCKADGAMLVLSKNVSEVQRIIIETVFPSISLNFLINPRFEQGAILSNIPSEYHILFYSNCLNPLPNKYGGELTSIHAQQLVLLEWRLLYDVLLSDTLKAFATHCATDKHYIGGGLAINHWLKLRGFSPILTSDFDFRFESKANINMYANQMRSVLERHTQTVRVNMSRLGVQCGDAEVSTDNFGCRIYFPLRYCNSSSSAATALSCYDFIWKVFDLSHNWKGDPIDIVKENKLCYIGEKEILRELTIDYGTHKENRRKLRLKFINFILGAK